jgi:cytochrome P450
MYRLQIIYLVLVLKFTIIDHSSFPLIRKPDLPVEWSKTLKAWTVHHYDDVVEILLTPSFSANFQVKKDELDYTMLIDQHKSFRQSIINKFQKENAWVKEVIHDEAVKFCDVFEKERGNDLVKDLVVPFCNRLALTFSGLDNENFNRENLFHHAKNIFLMTGGGSDDQKRGMRSTMVFADIFMNLIPKRKKQPQKDLITSFSYKTEYAGELISPLIQLFVGLSTSLPLLLGNIFTTLIPQKSNVDQFLLNPEKSANELLRLCGPAQYIKRICILEKEIAGHTFKVGDRIVLLLPHANRDENRYSCPHQFDLTRNALSNLSLGKGPHSCLGASLIREACVILPKVVIESMPKITIKEKGIAFGGNSAIQGVNSIKVSKT